MSKRELTEDSTEAEAVGASRTSRNWLPRMGLVACLCLLAGGLWLTFGAGDVRDFDHYRSFTGPAHRQDRCAAQESIATQVKIREHFESTGGITANQAEGMSPVVGLTPAEMTAVVNAKLYPLDLGCDDSVANPQVVVIGLLLTTAAVAALAGALAGAWLRGRAS